MHVITWKYVLRFKLVECAKINSPNDLQLKRSYKCNLFINSSFQINIIPKIWERQPVRNEKKIRAESWNSIFREIFWFLIKVNFTQTRLFDTWDHRSGIDRKVLCPSIKCIESDKFIVKIFWRYVRQRSIRFLNIFQIEYFN